MLVRRGPYPFELKVATFFAAYEPRLGIGILIFVVSGVDEGAGKIEMSSACAVPRSLSVVPSRPIDGAPNSEFREVHHSLPENFCMRAYLRWRMESWDDSEGGSGDFDLALDLMSALMSEVSASCMMGKMLSRSSGMVTELNEA